MKFTRIIIVIALITVVGFLVYYNQDSQPTKHAFTSYPAHSKQDKRIHEVYFAARDGKQLFYRFLPNAHTDNLIVLLHGSSYHGAYLTTLAEKLHLHADVCIPDFRGHGKSSPPAGTCSYIGQLEDDLADLVQHLRKTKEYKKVTLIGHSSGGGFAIRFAAGKHKDIAQSLILLSPAIVTAPTMNTPGARAWAHPKMVKIGELLALNAIGITRFNTAPVLTFNKPEEYCDGTETLTYDYNLAVSMHPRVPYKKDLAAAAKKAVVLVGENDEINNPYALEDLFPHDRVIILKNVRHLDIVDHPDAIKEIVKNL